MKNQKIKGMNAIVLMAVVISAKMVEYTIERVDPYH